MNSSDNSKNFLDVSDNESQSDVENQPPSGSMFDEDENNNQPLNLPLVPVEHVAPLPVPLSPLVPLALPLAPLPQLPADFPAEFDNGNNQHYAYENPPELDQSVSNFVPHSPTPCFGVEDYDGDSDKENQGDAPPVETNNLWTYPRSPLAAIPMSRYAPEHFLESNEFLTYSKWFQSAENEYQSENDETDCSSDEDYETEPDQTVPLNGNMVYFERARLWNSMNNNVDESRKFSITATKKFVTFLNRYVLTPMNQEHPENFDCDEFDKQFEDDQDENF